MKITEEVSTVSSKTCTQTHIPSQILTTILLIYLAKAMVDIHRYIKPHDYI